MVATYQRVEDLLKAIREFHEQSASYYAELANSTDKEKIKILFNYMSRHEWNIAKAMSGLNEEIDHKLLNTWMQYTPSWDILSIPQESPSDDITIDNAINLVMELNDRLVQFCSEAESFADISELKDLFGKMKDQGQYEQAEISKTAANLKEEL